MAPTKRSLRGGDECVLAPVPQVPVSQFRPLMVFGRTGTLRCTELGRSVDLLGVANLALRDLERADELLALALTRSTHDSFIHAAAAEAAALSGDARRGTHHAREARFRGVRIEKFQSSWSAKPVPRMISPGAADPVLDRQFSVKVPPESPPERTWDLDWTSSSPPLS